MIYNSNSPYTVGDGIGVLNYTGEQPPQSGFFSFAHRVSSMVGARLESIRARRFSVYRYANPNAVPATIIGVMVPGFKQHTGVIMQQAPAHSEQTSILDVIRAALRDAATAPSVFDALDLTGAALLKIADMAKAAT